MAQFAIEGADFDNIAPAKIAETGTYKLLLSRSEIKPNKAGTGTNFEFEFMVVDDPDCEGISFVLYQSLPQPGDKEKMTKRGQTFCDMKQEMLKLKVESFGGSVEGSAVNVPDEAMIQAVVEKRFTDEGRPYNVIQEETIKPLGGGKLELE